MFSLDGGQSLLVGDRVWAATGVAGAGGCPSVPIVDSVPDADALAAVRGRPEFGAQDMSLVAGVRGFTAGGFNWDLSASFGAHETDLFIENTGQRVARAIS